MRLGRPVTVGAVAALGLALGATCLAAAPRARPDWDALFRSDPRWRGADGAYSLPLSPLVTLWLFGDTVVAPAGDGTRSGATLVNNSLALQLGHDPRTARMRFYWGQAAGASPEPAPGSKPRAFFEPPTPGRWYWPFDGARTPGGLALFLMDVEATDRKDLFGFRQVGSTLAWIEAPARSPRRWRPRLTPVPFTVLRDHHQRFFGASVLVHGPHLLVFGYDETLAPGRSSKRMVLARAPLEAPGDFSRWQFLGPDGWRPDPGELWQSPFPVPAEFTVRAAPGGGFTLIHSSGEGLDPGLFRRLAPRPEGPWSAPERLLDCPEAREIPGAFCYSAKGHPEVSPAAEGLLVSYCTNAFDFFAMLADPRLYYPRIYQVPAAGSAPPQALLQGLQPVR